MNPYPALSNSEVLEQVIQGLQLQRVEICPESFWSIIRDCWKLKPQERPTFASLNKLIRQYIEDSVVVEAEVQREQQENASDNYHNYNQNYNQNYQV